MYVPHVSAGHQTTAGSPPSFKVRGSSYELVVLGLTVPQDVGGHNDLPLCIAHVKELVHTESWAVEEDIPYYLHVWDHGRW